MREQLVEGSVVLIDKPLRWTSFDTVNKVRWAARQCTGLKKIKVGHAGTLDPLATGLLIICTGRATKRIAQIQDADKEYEALFVLGASTASHDLEKPVEADAAPPSADRAQVEAALARLSGPLMQEPPLFSAKWVDGKRAYDLARGGSDRRLDPVPVVVHRSELLSFEAAGAAGTARVAARIACSKGTYIRSYARDLGQLLGCGCYLAALRRTRVGSYSVADAQSPEDFCNSLKNNSK